MAHTLKGKFDEVLNAIAGTMDGDAAVGNVLASKTFYNTGATTETKRTGTMPNNAGDKACVSAHMGLTTNLHVIPAAGYTDGVDDASTIDLATVDTDLAAGNIKSGVTLFGVAGTANVVDTTTGDALAAEILTGKKAWVDGAEVTGTMPDSSADIVPDGSAIVIPAGYHDGSKHVVADADLVAGNIKHNVAIYGVTGTYDTEAGNPIAAATVLSGKIGFVNGAKITGSASATALAAKITTLESVAKKIVTIYLNQIVTSVGDAVALKAGITLATNGVDYSALAVADTVAITGGSTIVVTLDVALAGALNKIKIAAGTVKDVFSINNIEVETSAIDAS